MGKTRKKQAESDSDDADGMETFYQERDEKLRTALSKTKKSVSWAVDGNESDENGRDEVLAFDDDSMDSDEYQQLDDDGNEEEEEEEEEEDLSGAYGSGRKAYYNEDVNADEEDAKLEEQEAVQIQKRYYEMLEKNDFGLDLFREKPSALINQEKSLDEQSLRRHIILPDNLLELSGTERLQLIRDQSPELEPLCSEFKLVFDDLKIYLLPLIQLVLDTSSLDEFQSYPGWQFVLAVLELYLTYCSYLSLYLTMKSTDLNLGQHPIVNDIEQYRSLCQLVHGDFQAIKPDLLKLCELLQERKSTVSLVSRARLIMKNGISLQKKSTNGTSAKPTLRERMAKRVERQQQQPEEQVSVNEVEQPQGKRAITYQIAKNKGLTVQRKKENRNPRVRHRNKYARALVKRKSRVPSARTEEDRYTGEATGIRAGQKRSIKLKS